MMKKNLILPLVAAIVAAGGAFATAETGMRAQAYAKLGPSVQDCIAGELLEPESCSAENEGARCQVEIEGMQYEAWEDAQCQTELFKPENP